MRRVEAHPLQLYHLMKQLLENECVCMFVLSLTHVNIDCSNKTVFCIFVKFPDWV